MTHANWPIGDGVTYHSTPVTLAATLEYDAEVNGRKVDPFQAAVPCFQDTHPLRKTEVEYWLMSNYGYGWEHEVTEATWPEMRQTLKEYRENCSGAAFRSVRKRVVKQQYQ